MSPRPTAHIRKYELSVGRFTELFFGQPRHAARAGRRAGKFADSCEQSLKPLFDFLRQCTVRHSQLPCFHVNRYSTALFSRDCICYGGTYFGPVTVYATDELRPSRRTLASKRCPASACTRLRSTNRAARHRVRVRGRLQQRARSRSHV